VYVLVAPTRHYPHLELFEAFFIPLVLHPLKFSPPSFHLKVKMHIH
jgi:hypothetical protein